VEQIAIRKATTADVIALALLARVTFREAFGYLFEDNQNLIHYFGKSFSIASLTAKIKNPNNVFWLALVDELPIGYAKLIRHAPSKFIQDTKVSELQRIYVLNDFLNRKIGHMLQEALFEEVRRLGSKHLWLSVYVNNPKAIRFYERYDYVHLGNHFFNIEKESFEFQVMSKRF
jgi:ribosomal protein S18 acetylase RimI-like enzyme